MIMDTQLTLEDVNPEYAAFVDKFKAKKTTDDCYTPSIIYDAILAWVRENLIGDAPVVRPFFPGGDYERFEYPDGAVVVDNPPFSILSKIVRNYQSAGIRFFLFAPHLTNFSVNVPCVTHVITNATITYENGAVVNTSFLTNLMPGIKAIAEPNLKKIIKNANDEKLKGRKKTLPKYVYPDHLLTATDLGYMAQHGVKFTVTDDQCYFVRRLDAQKSSDKAIFGGGFLLAEKAAAEKAAAEKAAAMRWPLSEREWAIIKGMG